VRIETFHVGAGLVPARFQPCVRDSGDHGGSPLQAQGQSTHLTGDHKGRPYVRLRACLIGEVRVLLWQSHSGQKPKVTAFPRGGVESNWR
jgi:hypothetical protein